MNKPVKPALQPVRRGLDPADARAIAEDSGMGVVTQQASPPPAFLPKATTATAEAPAGRTRDSLFQLSMPPGLLKTLKLQAVTEDTTVTVLVLRALAAAGYDVPAAALVDKRRSQ